MIFNNKILFISLVQMCMLVGLFSTSSYGQVNGQFIYGVITSKSGDSYEGYMRWGKEELTWHDTFNSTKTGKSSGNKGSLWGDFDWSIGSLWKDKYRGSNHLFACQFGDIAVLHNKGRERVDVELKNGAIIKVNGGSNDIGTTIHMRDYELGIIKFEWSRIKSIEFRQAPTARSHRYGTLLYGTAKTRRGQEYTGFIKWDEDERIGDDILDGDGHKRDQKVPFENIKSIAKSRKGSEVVFKSGRDIYLDGSNDVSDGNRGIIIFDESVGSIKIPWKYFQRVDFTNPPVGPSYRDYPHPQALQGSVTLYDGEVMEGQIVFDMDELWNIEILDGNDDDIAYQIPFRNIDRIIPKNRSYSLVYLRNGQELLLGDSQDVGSNNDGVLVVNNNQRKPITIDWEDIDEIKFK